VSPHAVHDTTARRLLALVANEQVSGHLPSLVAGVVRDGELAWAGSRGTLVSRDGVDQPTEQTQYRIGSITKTLTALLVMQLRDEGELRLSDRLDVHLPGVAYGDRALRRLMSHSSGMQAEPPGPWWERSPGATYDVLARRLDDSSAAFPDGEQFHYSNLAYALLGEVVARKTGLSWAAALDDKLLEPLGMLRTSVLPVAPAACGFSVHAFAGTLTDEPGQDTRAMGPAGQVWSTVGDLARYAAFLADPDSDIISPDTVREMTVTQSGIPEDAVMGAYGLGFRLAAAGERTYVGHTGSMPGFLAGLFVDRTRKTAAVCLANGTLGLRCQGLPIDLLRVLEEQEPTVPPAWVPSEEVTPSVLEVLGLWHWGNTAITMSYDGTGLVSRALGEREPWCTLRCEERDRFVGTSGYLAGETLNVMRRTDGSISHLECATFVFTRIPYDPEVPIPGG
jgi:CubicO group peptidase (beta-lactamase class C family)